MVRRLILVMCLLGWGPAAAFAADDFPYGRSLSFAAIRNGQAIGHHSLTFDRQGAELTVSTSIELAVKILGIVAYRYSHSAREVWTGGDFQSLVAQTDDNGKKYAIRLRRGVSDLAVERNVRPDIMSAATVDRGFQRDEIVRTTLPRQLLPSTHWNVRQVAQSALVNSQTGMEARIQVTALGREKIVAANVSIAATRYRYAGGVVMDQWFDDSGRWVKMSFAASDGSTIEYVLR